MTDKTRAEEMQALAERENAERLGHEDRVRAADKVLAALGKSVKRAAEARKEAAEEKAEDKDEAKRQAPQQRHTRQEAKGTAA
jgi:hypothetical protein